MPVTISAMVIESWSMSSATSTWNAPVVIHDQSTIWWLRSSAGRPTIVANTPTAVRKLSRTIPHASHPTTRRPIRRPKKARINVPSAGNKSINQA